MRRGLPLVPWHVVVDWLIEIGDASSQARTRLLDVFHLSPGKVLMHAVGPLAFAAVLMWREPSLAAMAWVVLPIVLSLLARGVLLSSGRASLEAIVLSSFGWFLSLAMALTFIQVSGDVPLQIVSVMASITLISGVMARYYTVPRYAILLVLIIDFAGKLGFLVRYPRFLPLVVVESGLFLLIIPNMLRRQQANLLRVIASDERNRRLSLHDPLTGLLNRRGFDEAFADRPLPAAGCGLIAIDLDGFKQVNDSHGHLAGDLLLQKVAVRLGHVLPHTFAVCRPGGDEFLAFGDPAGIVGLGDRILDALAKPCEIDDLGPVRIGASVGIVVARGATAASLQTLVSQADLALYEAKRLGRGRVILFDDRLRSGESAPPAAAGPIAQAATA